jgi:lysophospholipase L1-like esterase
MEANPPASGGWWARVSRLYQQLALVFFNLTILFVVWVFAVYAFLGSREPPLAHVYSAFFRPSSYVLTDPDTVRAVGREFDEMGSSESYAYNPWTTAMERPFKGRFLTVEHDGFTSVRGTKPPAAQKDGQRELLVWTLGGSTMFGWGLPDTQTIASHLQDQLQARLPQYRVRVINHGHSYYFSPTEVSLYLALLRTEARPDVVLFLDGYNDIFWIPQGVEEPQAAGIADEGWEAARRERYLGGATTWFSVNGSFPLVRLGAYVRHRLGMPPASISLSPRMRRPLPTDPAARIVEVYRLNRELAAAMSRQLGVDAYFFLQPVGWYVQDRGNVSAYQYAYAAYDALIGEEKAAGFPQFYSLHGVLWGVEQPYVDGTHYSDLASLIIAKHMADRIVPRWEGSSPTAPGSGPPRR